MSRRRLVVTVSAFALLSLGLIAALAVVSVTQTSFGRERVRRFLETRLASSVHGRMHIGRIGGGLLTGVTVDSIEIRDAEDSIFVASGMITIAYDPRDLLDRRILVQHLRAEHPVVHLRKHADGEWNFRRIFPPGPKKANEPNRPRAFGDFIVLDSATVHDATLTLTMPWHPDDSLRGARRDSAIAYNLARGDKEIDRTAEGLAKTWRWTNLQVASNYVRLADPDSVGRYFAVTSLSVDESDPPFLFRQLRAGVRHLGDSIWLDVPHFDLPGSTGRASGKVVWGSDLPIRYNVHVVGDSVSLADVAWVYPTLPTTGGGRMELDIRNQPRDLNVIDYAISKMDVRSTDSHLRGAMTFGVGGPVLIVKNVAMQADPMDFKLIRALNGKPFPYPWAGRITGRVRARGGPLTHFVVDSGDFVFRDANVPGATTVGSGRGELDILFPALTAFHGFDVRVDQLDLRTLQFLNPNFPRLRGHVTGTATLDSSWLDVRFRSAALTHHDGPSEATHMTGNGRVTWGEKFLTYDLDMQADPLSFTSLAASYPMIPVRGAYHGPLRIKGTLESLDLATTLTGVAGSVSMAGHADLYPPGFSLLGKGSVTNLDVRALTERPRVPATDLTAHFDATLVGDSLANLLGGLSVRLSRSLVDSVRVQGGESRLRFADGRVQVDTLAVETSAASFAASGALGLTAARSDSLRYVVVVDSLGGLRRYLRPGTGGGADTTAVDSLAGSVALRGVVSGSIDTLGTLAATGEMLGAGLRLGLSTADTLSGGFALRDVRRTPSGPAHARLDNAVLSGVRLAHLGGDFDLAQGGEVRFNVDAASENGPRGAVKGAVSLRGDTATIVLDSVSAQIDSSRWRLERPARVVSGPAGTSVDSLLMRSDRGGMLALWGSLPVEGAVSVHLAADSVPLADLGTIAQAPVPYGGRATFAVDVAGPRADPTMRMAAELSDAHFGAVRLERVEARGTYAERRLDGNMGLYYAKRPALAVSASLPIDLALAPVTRRLLDQPLRGSIRSDSVELAILEAFSPAMTRTTGTIATHVEIGGSWKKPTMLGELRVVNGSTYLPNLGVGLRAMNARVGLSGDSISFDTVTAMSSERHGGSMALSGGIGLASFRNPTFDLRLDAQSFNAMDKARVAHVDVSTGRGGLRLSGSMRHSTLSGDVIIPQGDIYIPKLTQKRVISLEDAEFYRVVDTTLTTNRGLLPQKPSPLVDSLVRHMELENASVAMGDDVWIRSPEANVKLSGRVGLESATEADTSAQLALYGTLNAERGTYRLSLGPVQRTFEVEGGTVRFFGERDLNPTLDISAINTVRQFQGASQLDAGSKEFVRIRVRIGGTLASPTLELSSADNLNLSQSDLISYLVTGQPSFEVGSGAEYGQTAAAVFLPSLGSYLGDRLAGGWFDVFQLQTGVQQRGTVTETGSTLFNNTTFTLGKQLNDRTFLSASAPLCGFAGTRGATGANSSDTQQLLGTLGAKLEHRLNNGFSVSFGIDPASNALTCTSPADARGLIGQTPRQIGLDFFREWQF